MAEPGSESRWNSSESTLNSSPHHSDVLADNWQPLDIVTPTGDQSWDGLDVEGMEIPKTNVFEGPACLAALAQPLLAPRRLPVDTSLLEERRLLVHYSIPASSPHSPDSDLPCAKGRPEFSR